MSLLFLMALDESILPWHEYVLKAKRIVVCEIVESDPGMANVRVERVLKGDPMPLQFFIHTPQPHRGSWCERRVRYENRKYIFCIDQWGPHDAPADSSWIRFTESILAGNLPAVMALDADLELGLEIVAYSTRFSRAQLKPFLQKIRALYPYCGDGSTHPWEAAFFTRKGSLLLEIHRDHYRFLFLIRHVTGRDFVSIEHFESWCATAVRRAQAHGSLDEAIQLVPDLFSDDIETRAAAREAILDLGPDALDALAGDDPEVISLREELELIADLRR